MSPRRLLILAVLLGVLGGIIAYTLTSYIARVYVEITQPAAVIRTYDIKIDAAPYQSFTYTNAWIADVTQYSDLVKYNVKIKAENVQLHDACITVMSWGVKYYTACGLEHEFTMKQILGGFSIYMTVKGKSMDKPGVITAEITYTPIP